MGAVCCEDPAKAQRLPAVWGGRGEGRVWMGRGRPAETGSTAVAPAGRALLTQDQHLLNGSFYF